MLYSFSIWWVILPLFALQYALAIFCLTRLAYCNISIKTYVIWNLVCLLVFFVGSFIFLIYYYSHKAKLTQKAEPIKDDILINDEPPNDDTLINDEPIKNPENINNVTCENEKKDSGENEKKDE